jgi:outer membrane protein assembly factor BamB
VGERLLVASCAGLLYALDRSTGEPFWWYDITRHGGEQFHGEMLVLDDRVIVGTDGERGNGHAVDLETGKEIWTHPCGTALRTDLRAAGDTVIGVARKDADELLCLRASDGGLVWSVGHDHLDGRGHRNSPVVVDGRVHYGTTDGRIVVYDAPDGRLLRELDAGGPVTMSLTHAGRHLYGGTEGGRVFRLDLASGEVDASFDLGGELVGEPAVLGSVVAVLVDWRSPASRLVALDPSLEAVRWEWTPDDPDDFGTIARLRRHDDAVILGTEGGGIAALDVADGTVRWRTRVEGAVRSAGIHEDVMYVGTIPGAVYAIRLPR